MVSLAILELLGALGMPLFLPIFGVLCPGATVAVLGALAVVLEVAVEALGDVAAVDIPSFTRP